MAGDLLIQTAGILTSADAEVPIAGDVLIRDGIIVSVGESPVADRGVPILDASDCFAIPGLVNAHLHSPGNLMRGTLDGYPLEVFMLYEVPPLADGQEVPAAVRTRTLLGAAEMLKLGITSVLDDAFFVPLIADESVEAVVAAYAEIGMRATIALDQPIVIEYEKYPFLADILPADIKRAMEQAPRETMDGMLAHYEHLISRWQRRRGRTDRCRRVVFGAPTRDPGISPRPIESGSPPRYSVLLPHPRNEAAAGAWRGEVREISRSLR